MNDKELPLRVGVPCPMKWEELQGGGARRFCEHCQLHVHNLSEMGRGERERFVAEAKGKMMAAREKGRGLDGHGELAQRDGLERGDGDAAPDEHEHEGHDEGRVCIAYRLNEDGSMMTRAFWRDVVGGRLREWFAAGGDGGFGGRVRFAAAAMVAVVMPFVFAGCANSRQTAGKMAAPQGEKQGCSKQEAPQTLGKLKPQKNTEKPKPASHDATTKPRTPAYGQESLGFLIADPKYNEKAETSQDKGAKGTGSSGGSDTVLGTPVPENGK